MARKMLVLVFFLMALAPVVAFGDSEELDIPFTMHRLDNGLTLIMHEDHKVPVVAVNVWYHVGAKDEKRGKTGFAHLFEHLMFNGSENNDTDYHKSMANIGATGLNGTTNWDRTNYFQNVPKNALDFALWIESDRMGHLVGAIDQAKLDEQRDVVKNEKRQRENQPYGKVLSTIVENTFPEGHGYRHSVIGSMEDLDAASVEDVHGWFKSYYGPSNAVLAVAGDIDLDDVKAKVEKYFGDIPPGPPVIRVEKWIPQRKGTVRVTLQDRAPLPQLYLIWATPEKASQESDRLALVSDLLSSGKSSRLYKRLVYDDQLVFDVSSISLPLEISGLFGIVATAKPGVPLERIEEVIDEELNRFLAEGPTEDELRRVRTQRLADFLRGAERIGGFGGKSDILASNFVYGGRPDYYKETLKHWKSATVEELRNLAGKWLSDGALILNVEPFPTLNAAAEGIDRTQPPDTGTFPVAKFPGTEETALKNGLKIIVVNRPGIPLVELRLVLDAGHAADQGVKAGTDSMTLSMLDEGTKTRSALDISDELQLLGASLETYSSLDQSIVSMSALKSNLSESLALMADAVLNPSFPEESHERTRSEFMGQIQQEQGDPNSMALRVLPKLLYGEGHAYSNPLTGSGTMASIQSMTRDDVAKFHRTWVKPNHATMVIVGDTTPDEIAPLLQEHFGPWKRGRIPRKNIVSVPPKKESKIYMLHREGAQQSVIFAGKLVPPKAETDEIALEVMNHILGGDFASRINMNLREEKGWSYGAFSLIANGVGQRAFIAIAPIQTDKTADAMKELKSEFDLIGGDKPVTQDELKLAKNAMTLELPGSLETMDAVAGKLIKKLRYGYPDDYFDTYPLKVRSTDVDDVTRVARKEIDTDAFTWVVVGDRGQIEGAIKALGFGEIVPIEID